MLPRGDDPAAMTGARRPGSIFEALNERSLPHLLRNPGADTIYKARKVITMAPDKPIPDADVTRVATLVGLVAAVGTEAELEGDANINRAGHTTVVDFSDYVLVPGFIESHSHPLHYSEALEHVKLTPFAVPTRAGVLEALRAAAAETEPIRSVICGWGYDPALLDDDRDITKEELDAVATDRPCFILHVSMHIVYANSKLYEMACITKDTPDPSGAHYCKHEETGELNGKAEEPAALLPLVSALPSLSFESLLEIARRGLTAMRNVGITSVTDAMAGTGSKGLDLHIYQQLAGEDDFPVRMTAMPAGTAPSANWPLHSGFGSARLRIGPKKFSLDGSVQVCLLFLFLSFFCFPNSSLFSFLRATRVG